MLSSASESGSPTRIDRGIFYSLILNSWGHSRISGNILWHDANMTRYDFSIYGDFYSQGVPLVVLFAVNRFATSEDPEAKHNSKKTKYGCLGVTWQRTQGIAPLCFPYGMSIRKWSNFRIQDPFHQRGSLVKKGKMAVETHPSLVHVLVSCACLAIWTSFIYLFIYFFLFCEHKGSHRTDCDLIYQSNTMILKRWLTLKLLCFGNIKHSSRWELGHPALVRVDGFLRLCCKYANL